MCGGLETMKTSFAAFLAGLTFGLGLTVSQMIDPAKVLAFLDVFGDWDPTLAFVMFGALAVTALGYRVVLRRPAPAFAPKFLVPTRSDIDVRLMLGASLFGIGWGIAGYCPGPAIAGLGLGAMKTIVFCLAMVIGMWLFRQLDAYVKRPAPV